MLVNLHIRNMALIDELDLDFSTGLNIVTGETGAGKSIIIGAILTGLGGKAHKDMIRTGAEYGQVDLLFQLGDAEKEFMKQMDLPTDGDGQVVISRKLYPTRSVNKINGETVTVSVLREVSQHLIDIHSQHENQSLLNKKHHLELIDQYGGRELQQQKDVVKACYEAYLESRQALQQEISAEERIRTMDFLRFEIGEIEQAKLIVGEEEELEQLHRKMSYARQIMEHLSEAHQLTGYQNIYSAGESIGKAVTKIQNAAEYDEECNGLVTQIETIDSLLNDFNRELADYMNSLTFDQEEYQRVEKRLDFIRTLELKYGKTIQDVLDYLQNSQEKLEALETYESQQEERNRQFEQKAQELDAACSVLTEKRKQVANTLTTVIQDALLDLNFQHVQFDVKFEVCDEFHKDGKDEVSFIISTNKGEPMKPLWEVASGGELSRIMLAIKSVLADTDMIDTLIFDEIDVGISGITAQRVAKRMTRIAKVHQVICITHLPQIAAMADAHYSIEKQYLEDKTVTTVQRLSEEQSIQELARLLGGDLQSQSVFESAKEMKELARNEKSN